MYITRIISHELYDKFMNIDNPKYLKLAVVTAYVYEI